MSNQWSASGFVIPFFAFASVVVIALCGLALDSGYFYLTQQRLQRAVDAGVIAGVYSLTERDPRSVEDLARTHIEYNLATANLLSGATVSVTTDRFHVAEEAQIDRPYTLCAY